ncbi:MAG: hypothetical protein HQM12_11935 [SAR324 cluster bacterium]|nr:hypothetical protein [SAR324 cluster bacterium]
MKKLLILIGSLVFFSAMVYAWEIISEGEGYKRIKCDKGHEVLITESSKGNGWCTKVIGYTCGFTVEEAARRQCSEKKK